jgi:hypothetical protein
MSAELDLDDVAAQSPLAQSELAALRKDAGRYRWLRDDGSLTWVPFRSQWQMDAARCDAAIDAEMRACDWQPAKTTGEQA